VASAQVVVGVEKENREVPVLLLELNLELILGLIREQVANRFCFFSSFLFINSAFLTIFWSNHEFI
jgi:hypothetical protein